MEKFELTAFIRLWARFSISGILANQFEVSEKCWRKINRKKETIVNVLQRNVMITNYTFFSALFSTQPQCFSWIELQMLLECFLIHKTIIILRHDLYLVHMCPCLDLGLFMSYLCDPFFTLIFVFVMNNRIISRNRYTCSFTCFWEYVPLFLNDDVMKNANNYQTAKVLPQGVAKFLLDFLPVSAWRCLQNRCLWKKHVIPHDL